jgi:hypothetical protein
LSGEQAAPDFSAGTRAPTGAGAPPEAGAPAGVGAEAVGRPTRPLRDRLASLRPIHWALIVLVVILFFAISGLLARFFATENVERDDILAVLRAEVVGNERGMLAQLSGCVASPTCVAAVKADAASLHRSGSVKILDLTSESNHSLGASTGPTRVAWTVIGHLPTVQCVTVKRSGNFFTGISVALLSIGRPINSEADC